MKRPQLLSVVLVFLAGAAAGFAGVIIQFARSLVTPPRKQRSVLRIQAVDRARAEIVLNDVPAARLPGRYGLLFGSDAGYLRFGEVLGRAEGRVVRALDDIVTGTPRRGQRGRDVSWYFLGPWELGLEYSSVQIATPLGPSTAWLIEPENATAASDWVIHVHGRAAQRAETLRGVRIAAATGWRSLVISYRNDSQAPRSVDGRYGLGATEAADVLAAMEYAAEQGAKRIVLFGWSMGGAIVVQAARAAQAGSGLPPIIGIVLESPALDWIDVLRYHARLLHLPATAGQLVARLLGSRLGPVLTGIAHPVDFERLDAQRAIAEIGQPVLLLHSADDDYVPVEPARRLAQAQPALVQYEEFAQAGHVRLWNHDPERWESLVSNWLRAQHG